MSSYSLCCFDLQGSLVGRDSFHAESNAEAKAIAGAICNACADEHHSYELWKGDLPIACAETLASPSDADADTLSLKARRTAQDRMMALRNSTWPVGRSRRMRDRIEAWVLGPEHGNEDRSPMRQFRRGIEYFVHSSDDVHWTWLANLRTDGGEMLQGTVNGTRAVAVKLCIAAIDEALTETTAKRAPSRAPISDLAEQAAHHTLANGGRSETPQVLVAEDETMFRDSAAELLKAAGFEVFQASDGEEALAILKEHPHISLLISDVRMPHMNGYELVEASLGFKPDLKVILMTGYATNTPPKFVQDRNIDTLRKPFDLNVLRSQVENLATVH